ncbi:MAG TPA: hypothetical protein VGM62_19020 [Chthoniobacterales bacterium]
MNGSAARNQSYDVPSSTNTGNDLVRNLSELSDDDGLTIRAESLTRMGGQVTKPLLYQLSYVGEGAAKLHHAMQAATAAS